MRLYIKFQVDTGTDYLKLLKQQRSVLIDTVYDITDLISRILSQVWSIRHENHAFIIKAKSRVKIDPNPLAAYFIALDVDDGDVVLELVDCDWDCDCPELGLVAVGVAPLVDTSTGVSVTVPVCVVRTVVAFTPFASRSSSVHTPADAESKPHSTWNSAETEPVAWTATSDTWDASSMSVTGAL